MYTIQNLSFSYQKRRPLLRDISLEPLPGQVVGLLGKNGTGKSSLLRLMAGLLKPTTGTLQFSGEEVFNRNPDVLAALFFLPEEFDFPAGMKVKEYFHALAQFYPSFDWNAFEQYTNEFEVEIHRRFGSLSFGQRKKSLIAFALASNCQVILMDEPTNGLDIPAKATFRKLVAGALSEDQVMVISTHQVRDLEKLIDHVWIIDQGTMRLNASVEELEEQFEFGFAATLPANTFYHEAQLGTNFYISPKQTGKMPTSVNLELLFNASISGKLTVSSTSNLQAL